MEEYRNRVIKLHAINPRIVANLLANLPRMNPRCMGAMGGPTPYEPLAAVSRPNSQDSKPATTVPSGCHGSHGPRPREGMLVGSRLHERPGPMAPFGGGNTLARRLCIWGVGVSPLTCSLRMSLPGWPPHIRGSL